VAMLHEDLIEVMPAVEEANSISEELDKKVKFEIMLISASMREKMDAKEVGTKKNYLLF
jgi:kinesin family protein 1